jgi:hypothetical protein
MNIKLPLASNEEGCRTLTNGHYQGDFQGSEVPQTVIWRYSASKRSGIPFSSSEIEPSQSSSQPMNLEEQDEIIQIQPFNPSDEDRQVKIKESIGHIQCAIELHKSYRPRNRTIPLKPSLDLASIAPPDGAHRHLLHKPRMSFTLL